MVPSPRLIILVLAAVPIFLCGAIYGPLAAVGLIYAAALGLYALIDLLLLPRRRSIVIRRLAPSRVSLASPTPVRFEIENNTRRRLTLLLAEDLPAVMRTDPDPCRTIIAAGGRATVEYRLTARKRGRYRLDRVDVRALPAGGLFYRQFALHLPAEVQVFPNLVNVRKYELLLRRGLTAEGIMRLRQFGQGAEFESLRQYADGDDMARIDWKATAKRSRLIVRNFEPERQQSVLVAIDVGRATAGEFAGLSRLDYLINAALMLGYVSLRQGDWFSLVAFSDRIESYLPPLRGIKNIDRVARSLYALEPRLVESDYGGACRFLGLRNRKRSLICVMTDIIDRQASDILIAYMARFARHHLPLAVTLANPEVRQLADRPLARSDDLYAQAVAMDVLNAREEALTGMRRMGISVLDVPPDALTPELINRYVLIKSTQRL